LLGRQLYFIHLPHPISLVPTSPAKVRVHDLRHTYGTRLRAAGVSEEDRALLLGHANKSMPEHYATGTVERLVDQANKVELTRKRMTILRVVNG